MPGGLLAPGHTRIIDMSDELYGYVKDSPFLTVKKEAKKKVKKKVKKKAK